MMWRNSNDCDFFFNGRDLIHYKMYSTKCNNYTSANSPPPTNNGNDQSSEQSKSMALQRASPLAVTACLLFVQASTVSC